jgi:hypothetical protein
LKKKRKKRKQTLITFRPVRPIGLAARARPASSLSRSLASGTRPSGRLPPPARPPSFPLPQRDTAVPTAHASSPSSPFLLQPAIKSRNCRAHNSSETAFRFPFCLPPFLPVMPAATNGSRRRSGSSRLSSPPSLCCYLSTRSSSCTPLCTRSTPLLSLEHQFPSIAASGSRRRRREFVAAGEGQSPPPFFLSPWVHQGLIKLGLLQVLVPGAVEAAPPITPERRPTCRRCQAPPSSHLLHLRARLPLL